MRQLAVAIFMLRVELDNLLVHLLVYAKKVTVYFSCGTLTTRGVK